MNFMAYVILAISVLLNRVYATEPERMLYANHWMIIEDEIGAYGKLTLDHINNRLVATHNEANTVDFFDIKRNELFVRVSVGAAVDSVYSAVLGNYYISTSKNRIAIISGKTCKLTGFIAVPDKCGEMCLINGLKKLLVLNPKGNSVWIIDLISRKIISEIHLGGRPRCIQLNDVTHLAYIGLPSEKEIICIDSQNLSVVSRMPTGAVAAQSLALDTKNDCLFVAGVDGNLAELNLTNGRVLSLIEIPQGVLQICYDNTLKRIYCASPDWLIVVNENTGTMMIIDRIYTATGATNVAVDLKSHAVWTTFTDGEDSYAKSYAPSIFLDDRMRY